MIPGTCGQINANQITQVKKRHKKNKAIIGSMTKKEIAHRDLFVKDRSSNQGSEELLLAVEVFIRRRSINWSFSKNENNDE